MPLETCGEEENGDIRLINETIVEVCNALEWRSVCDDLWGNTEAKVACRQLGLPYGGTVL